MDEHTRVITQGEHYVTDAAEEKISTLLGSCVACCLWDAPHKVGGMNHILLASDAGNKDLMAHGAGVYAMELLINDLLKAGAARAHLKAKIFGGATMVQGLSGIGSMNGAFVLRYLEREGIPCVSQSLGGDVARHVIFTPSTGAARMKAQRNLPDETIPHPSDTKHGNGVELL